jgi:hypothetical protein
MVMVWVGLARLDAVFQKDALKDPLPSLVTSADDVAGDGRGA